MVGELVSSIPRIYSVMDHHHGENQASIIEMEGKIHERLIFILIDLGYNYSYINPELIDKFVLVR